MSAERAPEFSPTLSWINADPQTMAAHHGRIVLVYFWSASSVYCHNVMNDLMRLQVRYPDALSVIALHIPKFTAEHEPKTLADICARLDVQLPVANDTLWASWQHYGISAWPTVVLVDPEGNRAGDFSGDDVFAQLETAVSALLPKSSQHPKPRALQVRPKPKVFSALYCPSGLLLHNNLLYVVDSGHHRVLECNKEGAVKRVFGNGLPLFLDGTASESSFNRPNAVRVNRDYLYVADTGNHAVRRIHLLSGMVDTLVGNGKPGIASEQVIKSHFDVQLNNPWSLYVHQDLLVIAEAGNNALSQVNLSNGQFSRLAGGGSFALQDGVGDKARMAHPLGISGDRNTLFVVEGASSSLRTVAVPEGRVNTLVGQGLYQFSNADGPRITAGLQHPTAVFADEARQTLWIADAYNHKIRGYNLKTQVLSTLPMSQPIQNPCALAADAESLWIADSAGSHIYRYFFESEYLSRLSIQMA